jgi:hypothetical protein
MTELIRSIASLDVVVDPRSLYLACSHPSLEHLDRQTIPFLKTATVRYVHFLFTVASS